MSFHLVPKVTNSAFEDPLTKSQLQKWDLLKGMQYHVFRYTKYYHKMAGADLAQDLLNDPAVQAVFKVMVKGGGWQGLSGSVTGVQVQAVPCTLTRMDLFDKLTDPGAQPPIVRAGTGELVRRMEDVRDGFQVTDNLRELLLCDDSENAELYTEEEKSQLLWHIFEHLCLGGPCCQFEEKLDVYLEAAKRIYKELLTVQKNSSDQLEVASTAFRISGVQLETGPLQLFPARNRNSFCYLTVDPHRRLAKLWYHAHLPFW